jgi:chromate reductase, NAD(P)H dehydrogenase (quinone)
MSAQPQLLFVTGSTKSNSTNSLILEYLRHEAANQASVEFFDLSRLPYFNPDLDNESKLPPAVMDFRNAVEQCDALLICTPEYVFSLPGIMKNALEWLVSTVHLTEKPTAFIIAAAGGAQAFDSLDTILSTLQTRTKPSWKLLISGAKGKVSEGVVSDSATKQRLDKLMVDFLGGITQTHS